MITSHLSSYETGAFIARVFLDGTEVDSVDVPNMTAGEIAEIEDVSLGVLSEGVYQVAENLSL